MGFALPRRHWSAAVPGTLCLGLFYLYVWLAIEPRLVYQAQEPTFALEWSTLREALRDPGGLLGCGTALLSQFSYFSWAGAAIQVGLAWFVVLGSGALLFRLSGFRPRLLHLVPLLFLLVLHGDYRVPVSVDLQLAVALGAAAAWAWFPVGRVGGRVAVLLLALAGLHWVAGGVAQLFALYAGLEEWQRPGRRLIAPAGWVAAALLPWGVARWMAAEPAPQAYAALSPLAADPGSLAVYAGLCLYPPVAALGLRRWRAWLASPALAVRLLSGRRRGWTALPLLLSRWPRLRGVLPLLALVGLGAAAAWLSFDGDRKALLRIDFLVGQTEWHQVLEQAGRMRAYDALAVYDINRALCHLDLLPSRMFSYPQRPAEIFLPTPEAPANLKALSATLLELGQVNIAEHMAQEALEIFGECPSLLQRLTLINVLKGRPQAARVYLGRLDRTLWHREWARRVRQAMAADPGLAADPEVARIRAAMVDEDFVGYFTPEALLLQALEKDRRNRMAFQYLVGHYLLTGQLERLAQSLVRLDDFPSAFPPPLLPEHCEEAVLLYVAKTSGERALLSSMSIHGRQIRPVAVERFRQFRHLDAQQALERGYGGTYWYYYTYRLPNAREAAVAR